MIAGLLLIAACFGVVAAARPAGWAGVAGLLPAAGYVVLLTLGQMLVAPAAHAWVPDLAEDGRIGLYTGALPSVSGLIILIGSSATGSLLDLGPPLKVLALLRLQGGGLVVPSPPPSAGTTRVPSDQGGRIALRHSRSACRVVVVAWSR